MLTVHHLGRSQSERIVWLCEELGIPYALKCYARAPLLAPADYKALHPIGSAPVITDGDLVMVTAKGRLDRGFDLVEARTGEARYFAGEEFTSADIMMGFSLTTMRYFLPYDLAPYPNLRAYLQRIGSRPAYRRA